MLNPPGLSGEPLFDQTRRFSVGNKKSKKSHKSNDLWDLTVHCLVSSAERAGFEPAKPFRGLHAFQACLFNHSSISPRSCWNRVQRYWFFLIMQEFRLRIYIEMQCLDAITWLTRYLLGTELIQRDKTRIADVSLTRWMVSFWLKCLLFHDTALWL